MNERAPGYQSDVIKIKRNEKKKKSNKPVLIVCLIVVVLLVAGLLCAVFFNLHDELKGTWSSDGITNYEFDGKGNGALILPSSQYVFHYEIDGKTVKIDFEDEKAKDSEYDFYIADDVLHLTNDSGIGEVVEITMYKTK